MMIKFRVIDQHPRFHYEGKRILIDNRPYYIPVKKFVVDRYRPNFIEIENDRKDAEYLLKEIEIL